MTTRAREMTFHIGRSGADTGHGHRATPAAAPRIPQLMSCFLDAVTEVAALTPRPVCPPCFAALRITVITLSYLETALGGLTPAPLAWATAAALAAGHHLGDRTGLPGCTGRPRCGPCSEATLTPCPSR